MFDLTARFMLAASLAVLAGCGLYSPAPGTPAMQRVFKNVWRDAWTDLAFDLAARTNMGIGAILPDEGPQPALRAFKRASAPAPEPSFAAARALPPRVDLRPACPPVYHQGPFLSCTAFAVAKGLGEYLLRRKGDHTPLSAAHFYAATHDTPYTVQVRLQETNSRHSVTVGGGVADEGAPIINAMVTLEMGGAVAEQEVPYPPEEQWATYAQARAAATAAGPDLYGAPARPGDATLRQVLKAFKLGPIRLSHGGVVSYERYPTRLRIRSARAVPTLGAVKAQLANRLPVVAGFRVHASFYGDDARATGRVPLPTPADPYVGGHAMLIVGYDDGERTLLVRNSWGQGWGEGGYCRWPYEAFERGLILDAWTVEEA